MLELPDRYRDRPLGRAAHSGFFELEPGIVALQPDLMSSSSAETALEVQAFLYKLAEAHGGPIAAVVFIDNLTGQSASARRVYKDWPVDGPLSACGLVTSSSLGRAIGSLFIAVAPRAIPLKLTGDFQEAWDWVREARPASPGEAGWIPPSRG